MNLSPAVEPIPGIGERRGHSPRREPIVPLPAGRPPAHDPESTWAPLYRTGAAAALTILALMPVQIVIWVVWPPPPTVAEFFDLFQRNWLLGLLGLDLLYMPTNALMLPLLLALCVALRRASPSAMVIALTLGLVSIAIYFASTVAFEMLALSSRYAAATSETQRSLYLAAGEAMLATYKGTAFDAYYLMNGAALLIIAVVMLRSAVFGRATAYAGVLSGVLMVVPSTAGTLGLVFALSSLAPWAAFSVLVARRLLRLGRRAQGAEAARPRPAAGERRRRP
jgi:hypothetical protein